MAEFKRRRASTVDTKVTGGIPGFKVFKPGVRASICFPDFKKHNIPSVGHIVPTILAADETGKKIAKQFMGYRDGHGVTGLMPWYFLADVARGVGIGDDRRTFIAADAADDEGGVASSCYGILFNRIHKAVKAGSGQGKDIRVDCVIKKVNPKMWFDLFANDKTGFQDVALVDPKKMRTGFVPWLSLYDNGRLRLNDGFISGAGPRDLAQILMLSGSAMQALIDAACLENPGTSPEESYNEAYVHGDFTALDGTGKFVAIYNAKHHKGVPTMMFKAKTQKIEVDDENEEEYDPEAAGSSGKKKGGRESFGNYSVDFSPRVRLPSPDDEDAIVTYSQAKLIAKAGVADNVLQNYDEIWSYFRLMSPEEQMVELASAFKQKPELLWYAFQPHPEYLTDEIKGILNARSQVAAPGGMQAGDDTDDDGTDDDDTETSAADNPYDDDDVDEYEVETPPAKTKGAYASDSAKTKQAALSKGTAAPKKSAETQELEDGMDELLTRTSKKPKMSASKAIPGVLVPEKKTATGSVKVGNTPAPTKVVKKVIKKVIKKVDPAAVTTPVAPKKKRPTDGLPG